MRLAARIMAPLPILVVALCALLLANNGSGATPDAAHADSSPPWNILVLIYTQTDFVYTDESGEHRAQTLMTEEERARAGAAAAGFIDTDIPALNSGNMVPEYDIRYPSRPLTTLTPNGCNPQPSYTAGPADTAPELDPDFDSVIVIWDDTGEHVPDGEPADLDRCGGNAYNRGTGQTFATINIGSIPAVDQRFTFWHEWGHSIIFFYDASGAAPDPPVDNHIDRANPQYVHCPDGTEYEPTVDEHDIGFTHDYYSGTTALRAEPTRCLGITPDAWATGGPVIYAQTHPNPGGSGQGDNRDFDADGFRNGPESYVGTELIWECAATPAPDDEAIDSYPPDFNDDRVVDITDVGRMGNQRFGAKAGDPDYNQRFDLDADGFIDLDDHTAVQNRYGESCVRRDTDLDGFLDGLELYMGTNRFWDCAATTAADDEAIDSYPPDFNDDTFVDITDVGRMGNQRLGAMEGDPDYSRRYDLNANGQIDTFDQAAVNNRFGESCARIDTDGDGYLDGAERYMGTDINRACPATTASDDEPVDAWPPDFNDDRFVDITDVGRMGNQRFGAQAGDPDYNRRYDMNADGFIDITDKADVNNRFGDGCS